MSAPAETTPAAVPEVKPEETAAPVAEPAVEAKTEATVPPAVRLLFLSVDSLFHSRST